MCVPLQGASSAHLRLVLHSRFVFSTRHMDCRAGRQSVAMATRASLKFGAKVSEQLPRAVWTSSVRLQGHEGKEEKDKHDNIKGDRAMCGYE